MRLNAKGKPIKFQLFDRNDEKSKLWALVEIQLPHSRSKVSLNEFLVRKGLARVDSEKEHLTKSQIKLLSNLKSNQAKAAKEGLGVWSDNYKQSRWDGLIRYTRGLFTRKKSK